MYCNKCGNYINDKLNYCQYCGSPIYNNKIELNKKSKIFLFVYYSVVFLLMFISLIGISISLIPNIPNEKISSSEFISYVENRGCTLVNELEENDVDGVLFYYQTDINSCGYQIGYMIISNSGLRNKYYSMLVDDAENNNSNITGHSSINTPNYNEYSTSGTYYKSVSLLDDSILYISTDAQHRSGAIDIKNDLRHSKEVEINSSLWNLIYISCSLIILLLIVSWWKLNVKFGRKGWVCLIPIYNVLCLSKDLYGKKIYGILLLIPIVNFICFMVFCYRIGKVLGKNDIICLLIAFLPQIFIPLVAFSESEYIKIIKN